MQQEPLSLLQFQKKFGTEKACQKQLFRMRWPEGFKCPHCGHSEAYFHSTRHLLLSAINKLTYVGIHAIDIACKRSMLAPYRQVPKNIFAD
jgi:23S rRNA A1618 N6-methylase RlmF